jgi:hypothetical protein
VCSCVATCKWSRYVWGCADIEFVEFFLRVSRDLIMWDLLTCWGQEEVFGAWRDDKVCRGNLSMLNTWCTGGTGAQFSYPIDFWESVIYQNNYAFGKVNLGQVLFRAIGVKFQVYKKCMFSSWKGVRLFSPLHSRPLGRGSFRVLLSSFESLICGAKLTLQWRGYRHSKWHT